VPENWIVSVARFGYAVRGLVFLAIGLVAIAVAVGLAERPRGSPGIVRLAARLPLGEVIVLVIALGFLSYAALNFAGARNPERSGTGLGGLVLRAADALTGAIYLGLAVAAVGVLAFPAGSTGLATEAWVGRVLRLPRGEALLGVGGILLLGSGAYLVYKAVAQPFGSRLDRRALPPVALRWVVAAARLGTAVRAGIFGVCGWLLIRAAAESAPEHAGGIGRAVAALGESAYGSPLVGLVGLGFVAYGAYQLVKARYRRMVIER
jgi:hypothetical protein